MFFGPVNGHLLVNDVVDLLKHFYWGSIERYICPGVFDASRYNILLTYTTAFEAAMASVYLHCAKPFYGATPHARLSRQLKSKLRGICEDEWVLNKELGIHIRTRGYVNVMQLPTPPKCNCSREVEIVGFDPDFRHWSGNCQYCNPQCDDSHFTKFISDNSASPVQGPPQEKLSHVKEKYMSAEEYLEIYKALLKSDMNAEREIIDNLYVRAYVKKWDKVEEVIENEEKLFTCLMFCKTENELDEYFLVGKKVRVES